MRRGTKRYICSLVVLFAFASLTIWGKRNDFGMGRNMELLVNMMRALSVHYVDSVDVDALMQGAAAGMVRQLDPYTEYIPEEEMSDFEVMTTGKYAGIGAIIRQKDDYVSINQPYEGSPADKAGLKIGDLIVEIDGKSAKGLKVDQVSSKLKGDPNTTVKLKIRGIDGQERKVEIVRARIAIPGIPYAGYVGEGIGYIQHSSFTEGVAEQMRAEIERLRSEGELKGLILDYRDNGGGILQEAVKILGMFVPKGTTVVEMRGKAGDPNSNKVYQTSQKPTLPDLPLVVLINSHSASAAEIVAGALQDLDRAVIVGQRSFGKGLVQTPIPLGYNSFLKLTTAKYYIPSGRCIQAIDYSGSQSNNIHTVPDSLIEEYSTKAGRKVYDGGGIMPDSVMKSEYVSRFAVMLLALGHIDDFGDDFIRRNPEFEFDLKSFSISDEEYNLFKEMLKKEDITYESETRNVLNILKSAADSDKFTELSKHIEKIESELKDDTQSNLETYSEEIRDLINQNIVLRFAYEAGVREYELPNDKEVLAAEAILDDSALYQEILTQRDTARKSK